VKHTHPRHPPMFNCRGRGWSGSKSRNEHEHSFRGCLNEWVLSSLRRVKRNRRGGAPFSLGCLRITCEVVAIEGDFPNGKEVPLPVVSGRPGGVVVSKSKQRDDKEGLPLLVAPTRTSWYCSFS
jgi:hypothetical protein